VPEIAKAFADADGDLEQFQRNMDDVGQRTITGLMASFMDLGDSEQEARDKANTLMIELGLIPSEVETIYNLAGIEEAKLKLDLLSGSIDALPDNVRTTVTQQIIEGDYVGALNTIQAYYDRHPAEVTVDANIDKALEAIRRLQTIARLANIVVSVGSQSRSASAGAPATGSVGVARTATATTSGGGGGGVALAAAPPVIRNYHVTVQAAVVGNRYDVQRAVTRALRNAERLGAA
jgi:hypothetical protein